MDEESLNKIRVLAHEWAARGRLDKVEPLARDLLAHDPKDLDGLRWLWQVYLAGDHFIQAKEVAQAALQHHGSTPMTHHMMSMACGTLGDLDNAEKHAREAVKIAPNESQPLSHLARIRFHMGDIAESDQLAMSALAIDPTNIDAINIVARCAIAAKDGPRTEAAIRQMLSLAPDDGFVLSEVGKMLFEIGRRASGMEILRSVLRADPANHRLHLTLGYAYIARGDWVDARRHFREALRIKPDLEQIRRLLRMGNKTPPPKMPEGWSIVRWIETWDEEGRRQRHLIE